MRNLSTAKFDPLTALGSYMPELVHKIKQNAHKVTVKPLSLCMVICRGLDRPTPLCPPLWLPACVLEHTSTVMDQSRYGAILWVVLGAFAYVGGGVGWGVLWFMLLVQHSTCVDLCSSVLGVCIWSWLQKGALFYA